MQACYDNLKLEIQILENKKKKISEDLIAVEEDLEIKTLILNGEFDGGLEDVAVDNNNDSAPVANDVPVNAKPPPFSFLLDPMKFNCRTVPKSTINRILATDYKNRKELQDTKMQSIASEVWKIDFHYKIAPKIKVHAGQGKSFSPCRRSWCQRSERRCTCNLLEVLSWFGILRCDARRFACFGSSE